MAKPILIYDDGRRAALAGTADGQLPTWNASTSEWLAELPPVMAGEYYVATTGSDTTGNGSQSLPFASIQKAVDAASLAYAEGAPVAINVAAGVYAQALTINRYNTYVRGAGSRPEENRATQLTSPVVVNVTSATDVYGRQVGLAGCYVSSGTNAAALSITGTGFFSVVVDACYLTTGNAGASASALACDNANARSVVTDSILAVGSTTAAAPIVSLTAGAHQLGNTRVQHGSGVLATATSKALVIGGTATLFGDRLLIEPRTNGYQVEVSGTWASTTAFKAILSNSSLANVAVGGQGISVAIDPPALALMLWNTAFNVTTNHAVYSASSSLVSYGLLTFLGASSSLSGIYALPQTVRVGATVSDSLTLPNLTAALPLKLDGSKGVTAAKIAAADVVGGGAGTAGYYLKTTDGTTVEWAVGGGGGSGTVTSVSAGTGIAVTGDPAVNPTVSLAALTPDPSGTIGGAATVAQVTVDAYGRITAATGVSIAIDASAVTSGTLSIARGGTGTGTAPTQYGVIYAGSASAYASTAAGTTGTVLKGNTGAAPTYGAVDLTADVTGTLGLAKGGTGIDASAITSGQLLIGTSAGGAVAARSVSGDATLSDLGAVTVTAVRGSAISTVAPTVAGQVLTWTGSSYAPVAIPSGGSGGGGVIYFFNQATNATGTGLPANTYQLGRTAQAAYSFITASNIATGGWERVGGFVTDAGDPNIATLPTGVWDVNVWATTTATLGTVKARLVLYAYDNATDPESGSPIATSSELELFNQGGAAQYVASLVVPAGVSLASNKRIYLKVETIATVSGQSVEFGYGDATPTHTHTTVPSVTGTGIVKVLNSVIVAQGSPVDLTSEVSGTLPIANGGTGGTATPTAGTVAYGTGTAFAFTSAGTSGQPLLANGSSAPAFGALDISTAAVTGTLPIARGGTNSTATPTQGGVPYGTGSAFAFTSAGTAGQVLTSNGTGAPTWQATPYDLSGEYPGSVPSGTTEELFHFRAVRSFTIKASGTNASAAYAETGPAGGAVVLTITKKPQSGSPSTVGTITYSDGSNNGAISISSDVSFVYGDRIVITSDTDARGMISAYWTFYAVTP